MANLKKQSFWIALISSVVAVGVHSYLTFKYYGLRFGAHEGASLCNLSGTWNCDAVSASSYSQFLGIPMALWGAVFNFMFAFLLFFTNFGWYENDSRGKRYVFWLAIAIGLASVVMGFISATGLGTYCLFCVFAYALSVVTFVSAYFWAAPSVFRNLPSDLAALFTTHKGTLATFIVIPAAAVLFNSMFIDNYQMGRLKVIAAEYVSEWSSNPLHQFDANTGLVLYKGTGSPKMEIVEFADFMCSHCKAAYFGLDAFVNSHLDTKLVYKFFPLDGACNPAIGRSGNGITCEAAYVAYCSQKLFGKGWEAHHQLFENQEKLFQFSKPEEVRELICKNLSIDCEALAQCTQAAETKEVIQSTAAEGVKAEVKGTPTVYVNGRHLSGGQLIPVLEAHRALITN